MGVRRVTSMNKALLYKWLWHLELKERAYGGGWWYINMVCRIDGTLKKIGVVMGWIC